MSFSKFSDSDNINLVWLFIFRLSEYFTSSTKEELSANSSPR